jgi:hypothetical protein
MKNENWLKTLLVFLSLTSFILTFLLYNTNTRYNKFETTYKLETDSLQILTDSLREENFILNVEIGRHEVSREEILGKYPKVNKEYQQFYEHETE